MTTALAQRNTELALAGPIGSLDAYMQAVSSIPVISREDEKALAIRFRDEDDLGAARELVLSHLRFVAHVARSYSGYGLPLGDLIQEGNVGLMKAVKRFDPEVGVRLVSFAVHWIRAEIHEFVLRNWRVVKVATTKAQRKLFFNLRKAKNRLGWFSHAEAQAVAKDLGVSLKDVSEMERRLASRDLSFDPSPGADEDEGNYSPAAYLPCPSPDPAALVESDDWNRSSTSALMAGLDLLDDRSRDILTSRWLGEKKQTLHQLADKYGVSAERIRQLEANAIRKLRNMLAD
jgi:RNA polymerase sigma-32 factor